MVEGCVSHVFFDIFQMSRSCVLHVSRNERLWIGKLKIRVKLSF